MSTDRLRAHLKIINLISSPWGRIEEGDGLLKTNFEMCANKKIFAMKNIERSTHIFLSTVMSLFFILLIQDSYGQTDRSYIRDGNKDYKRRNYSEAETKYRKSLEKNSKSYEGNYNLGNALYKQGKQDEAVKYYSGSAELNKDKSAKQKSYYNLGNALLKSDKYQESVDAYKQALKTNPNDEDARYNLAYALSKLRQEQQQKQQNKDQKKDQKQDQQKQKQQQQDQKNKQEQAKNQQQQKQQKISKEDAERMLQALRNEEKNLQKKLAKKFDAATGNPEKDW